MTIYTDNFSGTGPLLSPWYYKVSSGTLRLQRINDAVFRGTSYGGGWLGDVYDPTGAMVADCKMFYTIKANVYSNFYRLGRMKVRTTNERPPWNTTTGIDGYSTGEYGGGNYHWQRKFNNGTASDLSLVTFNPGSTPHNIGQEYIGNTIYLWLAGVRVVASVDSAYPTGWVTAAIQDPATYSSFDDFWLELPSTASGSPFGNINALGRKLVR